MVSQVFRSIMNASLPPRRDRAQHLVWLRHTALGVNIQYICQAPYPKRALCPHNLPFRTNPPISYHPTVPCGFIGPATCATAAGEGAAGAPVALRCDAHVAALKKTCKFCKDWQLCHPSGLSWVKDFIPPQDRHTSTNPGTLRMQTSIDFSGVMLILDPSCADWNSTPSSVMFANSSKDTI